ncbi:MAG: winged helix-turn-helix domain-containing protein [Candidatus Aenigmarchaeota archaeon]|nr:winged helix-turn-helix domain-containing protein [Candidatus Aenigmarchaeota archaeon]
MKHTVVAPAGDNIDALFIGVREFPTEKVVLITPKRYASEAARAQKELKKFRIPVKIIDIDESWESIFRAIAEIKSSAENILVNVATGDRDGQCAATSAAFVNGLKAFSIDKGEAMMLPVLKFSYYKMIPERKLLILKTLKQDKTCCASFEELSRRLNMSLPLVSYHINGNAKSEGLVQMGLADVTEKKGRMEITLTPLGKLLIDGHIETKDDKRWFRRAK